MGMKNITKKMKVKILRQRKFERAAAINHDIAQKLRLEIQRELEIDANEYYSTVALAVK
jgi:hypothetical protein